MTRKRTAKFKPFCIMLPEPLVKRIDAYLCWMDANRPGEVGSRSELLRRFLLDGIEQAERENLQVCDDSRP